MRLLATVFLTVVMCWSSSGQTYISTFAGGGLPVNIPATSAGLDPIYFVTADQAGNVFFVDQSSVLRLEATTGLLTLAAGIGTPGFSGDNGPATSAQLNSPCGVAVDSVGNLYIADFGNNRIRRVSNGVITTVAGNGMQGFSGDNGPATNAELAGPEGVAVDSAGNLFIADSGNVRVRRVSNGVITTIAGNGGCGSGGCGFSGDNGPATSAHLSNAEGIAVDSGGNLYIADTYYQRIRKVSNGVITTVAGNGARGLTGDNGPATSATFSNPEGIAVDFAGNLYVADSYNNRIRKVSNGVIATVAGGGICCVSVGDDGPATSAGLNYPFGVAVDSAGSLYVADTDDQRIRKVSNGVITTVAGIGGYGFGGDNGPATSAQLYWPLGVAVDSAGNVDIADTNNRRIRKVSNGVITTVAGNGTPGFSGYNGPATGAQLKYPVGVAVDSAGNLYIADTYNNLVRKVSNGVITTVAGIGTQGFSGDNGPATSAELDNPWGVAVDSAGNLYIADFNNSRIRKVSNGVITTVAGIGEYYSFSGDNGPATSAGLYSPEGIAVDSAGDLYIADSGNNRVRKVSNGVITTVAGNGTQGFGGDDGPATSAQLGGPAGVAVDFAGNLYIADSGNQCIRKVSNGVITTVAGIGGYYYGFSGDNGPATSAQLYNPEGISVDSAGNLYIADSYNNRIRILTPSGSFCSYSVAPASLQAPAEGSNLTVSVQTAPSCPWTVWGLPSWITVASATSGTISATISLAVTANLGAARTATIVIAGVSLQVMQQSSIPGPSMNLGGAVNGASYTAPVAPGSIAAIFGDFLLTSTSIDTNLPLETSLQNLSFQFSGGTQAPLYFVSGGQLNLQVPWELTGQSTATLAATLNGQTGATQTVNLAGFAPAIFTMNSQGTGQGAILDSSYHLVDSSNPATDGTTTILIYCTGLGPVTNQPATGSPAPSSPLAKTTAPPTVTIGGTPASVSFSGLAPGYVGLYQVNALVLSAPPGEGVPVTISIGGVTSNTVTIAVR
jgi:uncharacterized protein (TIGR03437 family)